MDEEDETPAVRLLVSKNLAKAIADSGLSLTKVYTNAGVSKGMLYYALHAQRSVSVDFLAKLAPVLGVKMKDFFEEE